jgi:hypothetical protein
MILLHDLTMMVLCYMPCQVMLMAQHEVHFWLLCCLDLLRCWYLACIHFVHVFLPWQIIFNLFLYMEFKCKSIFFTGVLSTSKSPPPLPKTYLIHL